MARRSKRSPETQKLVNRVLDDVEKSEKFHNDFARGVDRRYDAYRGILKDDTDAAGWTSKLHPRYIHQVIETITSSLVDDTMRFEIKPRPKNLSPDEYEKAHAAARGMERLLGYELDVDRFGVKQRPFVLQGNIAGLTVAKNYWTQSSGYHKRLVKSTKQAVDEAGNHLGYYDQLEEVSSEEYLRDGPCFDVVDVRDFLWQEGATSIDTSSFLVHRLWKTKDELEYLESQGIYGTSAGGETVEVLNEQSDNTNGILTEREQKYSRELRTKERVEVLEHWTDSRVVTLANRSIILSVKKNPFWHGQKPFVVASPLPDLFRVPGMSVVELVEDLQEMLWTLTNQRLDATRLLANPAYAVRHDLDDFGQLEEISPGALIVMEDVNQVKPFEINAQIPRLTLEAEGMIKSDLQNISGGAMFMSGMDSAGINQTTATGVSIVANLATRAMQARKINFVQAYEKMGTQWVSMLQQFLRSDRAVPIVGADAQAGFLSLKPEEIQGQFDVSIDVSNESSIRQERRAEAQAKLQVAVQAAPVFVATGNPLNLKAFMDDYLESYDIDDAGKYYSEKPQQQMGGQPGQPQPGGPPSPTGTGGVTNPNLAAGPTSPSNAQSVSPAQPMQQFGASQGGANNV